VILGFNDFCKLGIEEPVNDGTILGSKLGETVGLFDGATDGVSVGFVDG
jgi:hypothetical protein